MIIIRSSHAARRRDRAEARLLDEQTRILKDQRRERNAAKAAESRRLRNERRELGAAQAAESYLPWWRQPTIGDAIAARQARKREQPHDPQSRPGR